MPAIAIGKCASKALCRVKPGLPRNSIRGSGSPHHLGDHMIRQEIFLRRCLLG